MKILPCEDCGSTSHCDCPRPYAGLVGSFAHVIHDPLKQEGHDLTLFIPTAEYIEALKAGDRTLDSFGDLSEVLQIIHRPLTKDGVRFVTFYTSFSERNAILPGTLVEGRLVITSTIQAEFDREALVEIEYEFLRNIAINNA